MCPPIRHLTDGWLTAPDFGLCELIMFACVQIGVSSTPERTFCLLIRRIASWCRSKLRHERVRKRWLYPKRLYLTSSNAFARGLMAPMSFIVSNGTRPSPILNGLLFILVGFHEWEFPGVRRECHAISNAHSGDEWSCECVWQLVICRQWSDVYMAAERSLVSRSKSSDGKWGMNWFPVIRKEVYSVVEVDQWN